jgi:SAM-dependent methyltransferase
VPSLRDHYDEYYDGPSEWRALCAEAKAQHVLALWNRAGRRAAGSTVLEVGSGEGAVTARLRAAGFDALGADLSRSGSIAARRRGMPVLLADGGGLPLADDAVDLVVLSHVVEHLENPRTALAEAARVARWVFVEVPLEHTWRLPRDFTWDDLGHINTYDLTLIRHLLQSTGLRVAGELVANYPRAESQYRLGSWKGTAHWAVRASALWASPALARRLFVYHAAFLCQVVPVSRCWRGSTAAVAREPGGRR